MSKILNTIFGDIASIIVSYMMVDEKTIHKQMEKNLDEIEDCSILYKMLWDEEVARLLPSWFAGYKKALGK